jgi:hypothetical protein
VFKRLDPVRRSPSIQQCVRIAFSARASARARTQPWSREVTFSNNHPMLSLDARSTSPCFQSQWTAPANAGTSLVLLRCALRKNATHPVPDFCMHTAHAFQGCRIRAVFLGWTRLVLYSVWPVFPHMLFSRPRLQPCQLVKALRSLSQSLSPV